MSKALGIGGLGLLCMLFGCGDDDGKTPDELPREDAGTDAGGGGPYVLERSKYANVSVTGRLDYSTPEHWICRPDIDPDECARPLDATEVKLDGSLERHDHVPAANPEFDCFYVYPTVWLNKTAQMNDFSDAGVKLVLDALLSQAARFSRVCRMYAPMYRQAGLAGTTLSEGASKDLALQDVRDAFAYYLEHLSQGRKFVILGHSQGTFMSASMIKRDIDPNEALRARLISAVLLGGQPYTPPGEQTGGTFQNIKPCSAPGEVGCVIAYDSYAAEAPPGANALLAHVTTELANEEVDLNGRVICTSPTSLLPDRTRLGGSYFALELNNPSFGAPGKIPGIETPFVMYRDYLRGACVEREGRSYLEVSLDRPAGDERMLPSYRNPTLEAVGFGLHLVDYNIALDDLIEAVELQAKAAL